MAIPPPIVPAPRMPTFSIGRSAMSFGNPGIFAASRSAKNRCSSAAAWGERRQAKNWPRSKASPSRNDRRTAASTQSTIRAGAKEPGKRLASCGPGFREESGRDAGGIDHAFARKAQRRAGGGETFGERDRRGRQVAVDDHVDRALRVCDRGCHRSAGHDRLQRVGDTDQSRQPLRAACAGQHAERDFRQPDHRGGYGDAVVAAQGELESAAEGGAMDRGDHRLAERLDRGNHVVQVRIGNVAGIELGDVGACDECPSGALQNDCLDGGIGLRDGERILESAPHAAGKGVDRRIVDDDHADLVLLLQRYDCAHRVLPIMASVA